MEDTPLSLQFSKPPEPLKDWMGNIVKEGDTVVVIRTRHFVRGDVTIHLMNSEEPPHTFRIPNDFIWEIYSEHLVINYLGRLMVEIKTQGITIVTEVSTLAWGQDSDLICIKGKSDDKYKYIQYMGGIYSESERIKEI